MPSIPSGSGASWRDPGPDGHSRLARALAEERQVRVIEASLGTLPTDDPTGSLLVLFPTHRPPSTLEVDRIEGFIAEGGTLLLAADGDNAAPWAAALGFQFKGLPALLPADLERGCVKVPFPNPPAGHSLCLPSPTTFSNATNAQGLQVEVFSSVEPVFLDTDLDGNLSLGDQGPIEAPMILQWHHGGGRAIAVADADAWRNGALDEAPANLEALVGLARTIDAKGTIYLDSSGVQPGLVDKLRNPMYRALVAPTSAQVMGLGLLGAVALGAAAAAPRVRSLQPHDPAPDAGDPAIEAAGLAAFQAALTGDTASSLPPAVANPHESPL